MAYLHEFEDNKTCFDKAHHDDRDAGMTHIAEPDSMADLPGQHRCGDEQEPDQTGATD
ncbi:hypothetical protein D9M69_717770 [compost metagenome]